MPSLMQPLTLDRVVRLNVLAITGPVPLTDNTGSPVLLDVKGPFELQVGLVVVVDEAGDGLVVPAAQHARGSGLTFDWILLAMQEEHRPDSENVHFFSYSGLSVVLGEYEP